MTIVGTPGSSPSRRARRFSSAMSTFGSESSMPYRISLPTHQPFRPTAIAPRLIAAQKVTIHSGQLAARIATRSPRTDAVAVPQRRGHRGDGPPVVRERQHPAHVAVREDQVLLVPEAHGGDERLPQVREPLLEHRHGLAEDHVLTDLEEAARRDQVGLDLRECFGDSHRRIHGGQATGRAGARLRAWRARHVPSDPRRAASRNAQVHSKESEKTGSRARRTPLGQGTMGGPPGAGPRASLPGPPARPGGTFSSSLPSDGACPKRPTRGWSAAGSGRS